MVISGIIALIFFNVVLYCKWKQIKIAIAVIDATADFFVATKRINLVGITYFVLMAAWSAFWVACLIAMSGIAEYEWTGKDKVTHQDRKMLPRPVNAETNKPEMTAVDYMIMYMVFAFLWIVLWLKESNVFVLMASVSTYYFDSGPNGEG